VTLTERLRKDADDVWRRILEHPFVTELYTGVLPPEKFKFYVLQDYGYLVAAIRNLCILSSRAGSIEAMREMVRILHLESESEFQGYEELLSAIGCTMEDALCVEPAPVTVSYTSFLLSTSALRSFPESLASVLPCFWSYAEIAERHQDDLEGNGNGLYVDWASVYLSEPYLDLVNRMRALLDGYGGEDAYGEVKDAFRTASRFEHMFWESMYRMRTWSI
jgi:thiaminase/transcriptional activator TenA